MNIEPSLLFHFHHLLGTGHLERSFSVLDGTQEAMEQASRAAQAGAFIARLTNGVEALDGDHGTYLALVERHDA